MSVLGDLLHKIVDLAAGGGARQDLHDEIDSLDGSVEAASEPPSEDVPAEGAAPELAEPVPGPEAAPEPPADLPTAEELAEFRAWKASQAQPVDEQPQVQEPVQEPVQADVQEVSDGEADA